MQRSVAVFFALLTVPAVAQLSVYQNSCNVGRVKKVTEAPSPTASIKTRHPTCTVNVYFTGTTTPVTIYSSSTFTPLRNPFTATKNGSWLFYAASGTVVDVVMRGGVSNPLPSPVTLVGLSPEVPGHVAATAIMTGGQSGVSSSTGSLATPVTGRTFQTPLQNYVLYDGSPTVSSDPRAAGDPFATPYMKIIVQDTGVNDSAPYYSEHNCNNTSGVSPVSGHIGPCAGMFITSTASKADTHYGVWGQNTITRVSATNALVNMFGYELNQFNDTSVDSNFTPVGTFTRGPYFGFAATAAGNAKQVAAFMADDESTLAGNTGSGWHNGLFVSRADSGVLCGSPNNGGPVTDCITHSATKVATASSNYGSVPDLQIASVWSGGTHATSRSFANLLVPNKGSDPVTCEQFLFDTAAEFQTCSNGGTIIPGPATLSGGATISGLSVKGGVASNTGLQHVSGHVGCTTEARAGAACTSKALGWTSLFPDINYQLVCTLQASGFTGLPVLAYVTKTTGSFKITIVAMTPEATTADYDCIGMH